jgi:tetratricopeptide (TPR) repeat protein
MSDNYADETLPLFKLLKTEAFRFIVVRYNHYAMVNRLKEDLQKRFPTRKLLTIDARKTTYTDILQVYYDLGEGFLLVENFEEVLKNPELYAGLNQRRDKLAQYPIAFIALTAFSSSELYTRQIMEKMPDWWSFRSLVLDLVTELSAIGDDNFAIRNLQSPIEEVSTLGGKTKEEKEKELARLLSVVTSTPETETALLRNVYEQIGEIQEDLAVYPEAEKFYLKAKELTLVDDIGSLGLIYLKIGRLYFNQKKYKQAEQNLLIAKELYEQNKTTLPKELARVYHNLGNLYYKQSKYQQAETHLVKAKELKEKDPTILPKDLAITYGNLGYLFNNQGSYAQAEINLLKSKELFEQDKTTPPKVLAKAYGNLGLLYISQRKYAQAETYYLIAKDLFEKDQTTLLEDLATFYNNLGLLYIKQGKYQQSEAYYLVSKELKEKDPTILPKDLATVYSNLGVLYVKQGNYEQAEKQYLKANELFEKDLTTLPKNLASAYHNLGNLYYRQKKYHLVQKYLDLATRALEDVEEEDNDSIQVSIYIKELKARLTNLS